jgi:hypothetical protein
VLAHAGDAQGGQTLALIVSLFFLLYILISCSGLHCHHALLL